MLVHTFGAVSISLRFLCCSILAVTLIIVLIIIISNLFFASHLVTLVVGLNVRFLLLFLIH